MGPALPEGYAEAVSSLKSYIQTCYFPYVISTDDSGPPLQASLPTSCLLIKFKPERNMLSSGLTSWLEYFPLLLWIEFNNLYMVKVYLSKRNTVLVCTHKKPQGNSTHLSCLLLRLLVPSAKNLCLFLQFVWLYLLKISSRYAFLH